MPKIVHDAMCFCSNVLPPSWRGDLGVDPSGPNVPAMSVAIQTVLCLCVSVMDLVTVRRAQCPSKEVTPRRTPSFV